DKPIVLCMGGSLGAREINNAIVEVIATSSRDDRYNFIVSTGKNGMWVTDKLADRDVDLSKKPNVKIRPYIDDMARCLSAADLVICRAGASSLSEIEALGKPSILIPSPNVTENHQYHNAMALVKRNAAMIIEEKDLNGRTLCRNVDDLLRDKRRLKSIGENARGMAVVDATSRICDIVEGLIKK
ncbi:MAG: UDP-N-acetylglucosamine--N-acetylmuramyl-(pentapeptide) pyrophosphoryl-undecaprenol N-acetylglucosamine transferase, partial [Clostridia bacterium]|nr:UDP-N-acetylglucosamine--N-acetylmuramyl-(pentapeptide) pyrophosphoryl-undecaprenol N-acetylglucosamine transferase [Clostridia bacterium]